MGSLLYKTVGDQIVDLLSHIEQLEKERDEAHDKMMQWNQDAEIQAAQQKEKEAYSRLTKGFAPDDMQWSRIDKWEKKHTSKHHQYARNHIHTKKGQGPCFRYSFEGSPIGNLGSVVCVDCERKALKKSLGNEKVFRRLCERYDAIFFIGEV